MKRVTIALLVILCSSIGFGQSGFYGKKTVISVDGSFRGSLFYNALSKGQYNLGELDGEKYNKFFSGGFGASISHYFNSNQGIGLEFNMTFNHLRTIANNSYYGDFDGNATYGTATMQSPQMQTIYIMPKFEWARGGNLPVGISYSVGLGYSNSRIIDEELRMKVDYVDYNTNELSSTVITRKVTDEYVSHGVFAQYGIKFRFPITRFLSFDLGTTFRFHFPKFSSIDLDNDVTSFNSQNIKSLMINRRGMNLMDIRAGLTFILF